MVRTPLDALITRKTLDFIYTHGNWGNGDVMDLIIDHAAENGEMPFKLKNVCAKVSEELANKIDEVCGLLEISKRRFLEAAFIEAILKANEIMDKEGLWDCLEEDRRLQVVDIQPVEEEKEEKH